MKKLLFLIVAVATLGINSSLLAFKRLVKNDTDQVIKVTLAPVSLGGQEAKATVKPQEMKKIRLAGRCIRYIKVNDTKVMAHDLLKPTKSITSLGEVETILIKSGAKRACGDLLFTVKAEDMIIKSKP